MCGCVLLWVASVDMGGYVLLWMAMCKYGWLYVALCGYV